MIEVCKILTERYCKSVNLELELYKESVTRGHSLVMDDSRIRNLKSRFFPRIGKNRNIDLMTSPALENSLSLATDVAGISSKRRATLATSGYDITNEVDTGRGQLLELRRIGPTHVECAPQSFDTWWLFSS